MVRTTLRSWLSSEPFTLGMSSGFFSFFAHTGMLRALVSEGLRPRAVSGSSAGALVAGAFAAGIEPDDLSRVLASLERAHFWDPAPGLGLLRGRLFAERLRSLLPVGTFEACRVPAAISLFDVLARATVVKRAGDLALAIQASCAVPLMFHPVWIDGRPFWDGGVRDRPGISGVPDGERLLFHHIASRSPWRAKGSAALAVPARRNMTALVVRDLPRSGPFKLEAGVRAAIVAYDATKRALGEAPIEDGSPPCVVPSAS
jgi:NTE family protein